MKLRSKKLDRQTSSLLLKNKAGKTVTSVFRYAFLLAISYVVIVKLAYILAYSFRPTNELDIPSIVWVTRSPTFDNIKIAFRALEFVPTFLRTIGIQILSGMIEVIACAIPAYGLSRFKFRGKNLIFGLVLATVLIPPQMTAISLYLIYSKFDILGVLNLLGTALGTELRPNMLDTGWVFWLPSLLGVGLRSGLFIFIYRQFFLGLPKELEEAAAIDGAGPLTTFTRVILPSSGVIILTVSILSVVWHWNDYYLSSLYFTDEFPLSVMLDQIAIRAQNITGIIGTSNGIIMAGCLLFILPLLIMYAILQRKFIASIDRVGIVG